MQRILFGTLILPELKAIILCLGRACRFPMYSAISVGGKKLYKLARQGIVVEQEPRPITASMILSLLTYQEKTLLFEVTCSREPLSDPVLMMLKKTYLGRNHEFSFTHKSGDFTLENAHTLEKSQQDPLWDRSFIRCGAASAFFIGQSMTSKPATHCPKSHRQFAALKGQLYVIKLCAWGHFSPLPVC